MNRTLVVGKEEEHNEENMTQFLQRLERENLELLRDRYNIVLELVQKMLRKEVKQITDFNNISSTFLFKNEEYCKKLTFKYGRVFKKKLKVEFNGKFDEKLNNKFDADNFKVNDIILVLSKGLSGLVNYKLRRYNSRNKEGVVLYTIKCV